MATANQLPRFEVKPILGKLKGLAAYVTLALTQASESQGRKRRISKDPLRENPWARIALAELAREHIENQRI